MNRVRGLTIVSGFCIGLAAGPVLAQSSLLVGQWHWNRAQSTVPAGEPQPDDLALEIARADVLHVKWILTTVREGETNVESFDAPANGEFYPVSSDTSVSFQLSPGGLQATFKSASGQSDVQTCTVSADQKKLTCQGVLNGENGKRQTYVDTFDRM